MSDANLKVMTKDADAGVPLSLVADIITWAKACPEVFRNLIVTSLSTLFSLPSHADFTLLME